MVHNKVNNKDTLKTKILIVIHYIKYLKNIFR